MSNKQIKTENTYAVEPIEPPIAPVKRPGRVFTIIKNAKVTANICLGNLNEETAKRAVKLILSIENEHEETIFFEVLTIQTGLLKTPAEWLKHFKSKIRKK